ncbi:ABC-type transport system, involved in lipoprotein release, putative [Priestia megaterium WSH-002]|uniref:ABC-type transport system, involved in lipoprotein release, putative n=1 Tax=Priestia megaterium (strain WSH-002) TaxID=1006007 RepID=A0A8D3WZC3_PRIMW|nr:ABC-type transport system, involved in lipoprotein release, putative [Priestia megaterium WSH-002]
MRTIKGVALRLFKANKFIVFSSILSIAISATLVLSMVLFSFNAQNTLKNQMKQAYGEMDLSVGFNMDQSNVLTPKLVNEIVQNKKVNKVSKVSIAHLNVNKMDTAIYTVGAENNYLPKSRYHFTEDLNEESVVMNKGLAKVLHAKIGDKILIENKKYTLVETVDDLTATGSAPDMLILNQKVVKSYIQAKDNRKAEATYLLIKAKKNVNTLTLANQIKSYDKDLRIDIAEQDYGVKSNLQSLHLFIVVLSVLVLIVTSLIIISNFELLLYKMRNQFAIMRSLGASTKQISKIIMIQSTVINITGISLGFILNFLSQRTLYSWVEKLFNIPTTPSEFNVGAAISISILAFIVIQLFLFVPAYRSTKVLPLKTMEENEKLNYSYSKVRVTLSKVLVGIAVFLIIGSQVLPTRGTYGPAMLLISAVLVLLAFVLVFPIWLPKILEWFFLPYGQRLFGQEFYISVKNLIPQVRKNTAIILMISSLMIIAVFGSVTLRTIQISQLEQLKKDFATPILIETRIDNSKINSMEFTKTVEELSGVKSVSNFSTLGLAELQTEGKKVDMNYAVVDLKRLQAQGLMAHLNSKTPSNGLILSERFAQQSHLKVGQTVPVGEFSNETQIVESKGTFKVIAIEKQLLNNADAYVDWNNQKLLDVIFYTLYVDSEHIKNTVNELEELKSQYPEIKISNYEQSVKEANKMFYQRWGIFILVIATLVASTMVGVFNSLANNIYSKRKEFAVLRAMGVTPKGLRKVILSQVNLYIGIGLIIGIIMGLLTTFILLLVDPGEFVIDYKVIITVSLLMLAGSTLIFWFVGNKILSQELSIELTNDNK